MSGAGSVLGSAGSAASPVPQAAASPAPAALPTTVEPRVSVVVIFLDAAEFLEEAIASVFAQSYPHWELLLVDDGSTDASSAIARGWASRRPDRVRYLEHPGHVNRGMSAARNLGLAQARGEYVALLDADDVWLPDKLERQVALLDAHPRAAMVYGAPLYWFGWTGDPEDARRDYMPGVPVPPETLVEPPGLLALSYPLGSGPAPCPSDLMFRTTVARRLGGFEESFTGIHQMYEDQAFLAKIYLEAPVYVSGECWDRYRQHPRSCVAEVTRAGRYGTVRLRFLGWLGRYLAGRGVKDPAVWRALRRARWRTRWPRLAGLPRLAGEAGQAARHPRRPAAKLARRLLPAALHRRLAAWVHGPRPAVGRVRLGQLRRLSPISRAFGFDRGLPVDRHYLEGFLARHAADVRGRVLEVGDDSYTKRFGGGRVVTSDVLHVRPGSPGATIVADLAHAGHVPAESFDCIILTQTLHLIYDLRAAVATLHRILAPGGVLLATVPGISPLDRGEWGESWCWSLTALSARRLLEEAFPAGHVEVETQGNVLAACAFLHGLAAGELTPGELDHRDPCYPVLVAARAVKALAGSAA